MKTYFISSLFPNELKEELLNKSVGATANANNAFQWALYTGLRVYYPNLYLLNFPNVGAYPVRFKKFKVNGSLIKYNEITVGESFSFINLIQLKHYFKYLLLRNILKNIFEEDEKDFVFFVYDLYPPFLNAINKLKKSYPNKSVKICLIVPDLHGLTGIKSGFINNIFLKFNNYILDKSYGAVDYFVFLTKFMAERMPVNNRPWVCIEGIFDSNLVFHNNVSDSKNVNNSKKRIFYSGAIDERNGIINLLKAFEKIKFDNYELLICGEGALSNLVSECSKKDPRIIYLGQIPRERALCLQSNSTLLINPRVPGQNFTKYSFPSKTMEYLASGTPTLMYNLEGLPTEYHNYCFIQQDLNVDSLYKRIIEICEMDAGYLYNFGQKARRFVLEYKTPEAQCLLIYNMIRR